MWECWDEPRDRSLEQVLCLQTGLSESYKVLLDVHVSTVAQEGQLNFCITRRTRKVLLHTWKGEGGDTFSVVWPPPNLYTILEPFGPLIRVCSPCPVPALKFMVTGHSVWLPPTPWNSLPVELWMPESLDLKTYLFTKAFDHWCHNSLLLYCYSLSFDGSIII